MNESRLSRRRLLAGAGTGLAAAIAGCSLGAPQSSAEDPPPEAISGEFPPEFQTPGESPDEPVADSGLAQVYADIVDSVGAVRLEGVGETEDGVGGGSAWVYQDDYLVTNEHVVNNVDDPFVWFNETGWREATVVGTDIHSDLAVIEVVDGRPEQASALPLVSEPVAVGTEIAAIGNPFDLTSSFTTGVVSGRNRNIELGDRQFSIADGIQIDAAVNPGNSGGPVVTHDREVAGIVNAGIRGSALEPVDNVGFAISARMANRVIPALIEDGEFRHSRLGVLLTDVTPALIEANDLGVTFGVYIVESQADGPAEDILQGSSDEVEVRGQLVPTGGDVIVGLSKDDIEWPISTTERLSAFLALHTDPGDTITVTLERDGERTTEEVTLGDREGTEL